MILHNGTWFFNPMEIVRAELPDVADALDAEERDTAEDVADAWREYDRMEERAGNYETGCDVLLETVYALLSGQATTRAARNALRADLEERLPACVLEERIMRAILTPERDSRGCVV